MANGDGGEFSHYLLAPNGEWRQITRLADEISRAVFGQDGRVYLLSRQNAPRGKILRLAAENRGLAGAQIGVPESKAVIQDFLPAATRLYVEPIWSAVPRRSVFSTCPVGLWAWRH